MAKHPDVPRRLAALCRGALPRRAHAGYRRGATAPGHGAGVASLWPSRQARQASHRSPATAAISDAHAGRVHDGPPHDAGYGDARLRPQTARHAAPAKLIELSVIECAHYGRANRHSEQLRSITSGGWLGRFRHYECP